MAEREASVYARLLKFARVAGRLKRIERTGWSVRNLPGESVADHTFRTALLATLLAEMCGGKLDNAKILRMALLHDMGESYMFDWDRESQQILGTDTKKQIESLAVNKICSILPDELSEKYLSLWDELSAASTPEAQIVRFSDKLDAVLQAREMVEAGLNKHVYDEFRVRLDLTSLDPTVKRVCKGVLEALGE